MEGCGLAVALLPLRGQPRQPCPLAPPLELAASRQPVHGCGHVRRETPPRIVISKFLRDYGNREGQRPRCPRRAARPRPLPAIAMRRQGLRNNLEKIASRLAPPLSQQKKEIKTTRTVTAGQAFSSYRIEWPQEHKTEGCAMPHFVLFVAMDLIPANLRERQQTAGSGKMRSRFPRRGKMAGASENRTQPGSMKTPQRF